MPSFLDDYEPVEDRLREFWADHPKGRIETELIAHADGDYIVKASVWRDTVLELHEDPTVPHATGYAHDSEAQLPPNMKASALEVCETSAIGRALANLGYAAKGKRPSREEMSKASVDNGEVSAATEPGEGRPQDAAKPSPGSTKDAPGPPHYPLRPDECDHKSERTGHLLRPRSSPRGPVCPRCGLSYITVTEGTNADLGSA